MDRIYLLRVSNYERLVAEFTLSDGYYRAAHEILADLEKEVCYREQIDDIVGIPYKPEGDVVFTFDRKMRDGNNVFLVYKYSTTAS